ncbi:hypothetical protein [Streptomyces albipurpureus]|uniref:Uncharacterized protein n=1 Tax=Streptomyces albipurpureus TaxID=2897419 RepID=A0ABT0UI77_9ACTN|nr:hypothetical protein [Streptomyces sp. CWNU-1]MCM2387785.1 hypothetical protein [Streptomyces sp. CWNU-1]
MADIELPSDLIQLETRAWQEIQAGALTTETAYAVQTAITEYAKASGQNRYEIEQALKRRVRHQV